MAKMHIVWRHIRTDEQIADMMTKSLAASKQRQHTDKILVRQFTNLVNTVLRVNTTPWWDTPD